MNCLNFLMVLSMFFSHAFTFGMPASELERDPVSEIESSIRDDTFDTETGPTECQRAENSDDLDEIKQIKNKLSDLHRGFIKLLALSEQFRENDSKFEKGIENLVQELETQLPLNKRAIDKKPFGTIEMSALSEEEFQGECGSCWVLMDEHKILKSNFHQIRSKWIQACPGNITVNHFIKIHDDPIKDQWKSNLSNLLLCCLNFQPSSEKHLALFGGVPHQLLNSDGLVNIEMISELIGARPASFLYNKTTPNMTTGKSFSDGKKIRASFNTTYPLLFLIEKNYKNIENNFTSQHEFESWAGLFSESHFLIDAIRTNEVYFGASPLAFQSKNRAIEILFSVRNKFIHRLISYLEKEKNQHNKSIAFENAFSFLMENTPSLTPLVYFSLLSIEANQHKIQALVLEKIERMLAEPRAPIFLLLLLQEKFIEEIKKEILTSKLFKPEELMIRSNIFIKDYFKNALEWITSKVLIDIIIYLLSLNEDLHSFIGSKNENFKEIFRNKNKALKKINNQFASDLIELTTACPEYYKTFIINIYNAEENILEITLDFKNLTHERAQFLKESKTLKSKPSSSLKIDETENFYAKFYSIDFGIQDDLQESGIEVESVFESIKKYLLSERRKKEINFEFLSDFQTKNK